MRPQLSPHSALRALAGMSCVLGVVALLSGGCGGTPDNFSVLVLIENVPLDGSQLTVKAMLDGKSASNQLDVTNSLTRFWGAHSARSGRQLEPEHAGAGQR